MLDQQGFVHFEEWRLQFSWASLLRLHSLWGENFELRVNEAWSGRNLQDIATLVEVSGGPSAEDVITASPAIMPLMRAQQIAWQHAYLGYKAAKGFEEILKREAAEAGDEKKTFRLRSLIGWWKRTAPHSQAA